MSQADLFQGQRSHVPVAVMAERWRNLEAERCQGKPAQPLLWRAVRGNSTVYLLASYHVTQQAMEPMFGQVRKAMECADVAYFELACALGDQAGMGHYFSHCLSYPVADSRDSVAARLPPADLQALQAAVQQLADGAPAACQGLAERLPAAAAALGSGEDRGTLLAFYHRAVGALNAGACGQKQGAQMYEDSLRAAWGSTRPIFGLRDVSVQCAIYQGNSVEQDVKLARSMTSKFSNAAWRQNVTRQLEAADDIMHCGDLDRLAAMRGSAAELPRLGVKLLSKRNPVLARGIVRAVRQHPGRPLLAVIGAAHFLEVSGIKSVTMLLNESGFTVERITAESELNCQSSTYAAPGAKQLEQCLMPPGFSQPASCNNFTQVFAAATGRDKMYGRSNQSADCKSCVNSSQKCTCSIMWRNDTDFKDLCTGTSVDGVHGQLMVMDLTRNPGSTRPGPALVEKTVRSLFQNCYATSCQIPLLQEMALRNWYKTDRSLAAGVVTLRYPGKGLEGAPLGAGAPGPTGSRWPWWLWLAALGAVLGLIGALVRCFLTPKRKRGAKRAMLLGEPGPPAMRACPQAAGPEELLGDRPPSPWPTARDGPPAAWAPTPGAAASSLRPPGPWPPTSPRQAPGALELDPGLQPPGPWPPGPAWPGESLAPEPPPGVANAPPELPAVQLYDSTLIAQAMQMQQVLGDAGAQAVQQMQMQAMQNWQMTAMPSVQPMPLQLAGQPNLGAYPPSPHVMGGTGQLLSAPGQQSGLFGGHQQLGPPRYSPLGHAGSVPAMPYAYPRMA